MSYMANNRQRILLISSPRSFKDHPAYHSDLEGKCLAAQRNPRSILDNSASLPEVVIMAAIEVAPELIIFIHQTDTLIQTALLHNVDPALIYEHRIESEETRLLYEIKKLEWNRP